MNQLAKKIGESLSAVAMLALVSGCNVQSLLGKTESKDSNATPGTQITSSIVPGAAASMVPFASTSIASGREHTCAIHSETGLVECWGKLDSEVSRNKPGAVRADAIAAGAFHTCYIEKGTSLPRCWGEDAQGQIPDETFPVGRVTAITAGMWHTCFIQVKDGSPFCIGGRFSDDTTTSDLVTPLPLLTQPKMISAGTAHTCAVNQDDSPQCWPKISGTRVVGAPAGLEKVKLIASGYLSSCAILDDFSVSCWGQTSYGAGQVAKPENLKAKALALGGWSVCAIQLNDELVCWGSPEFSLMKYPQGLLVKEISAGDTHACAITLAGKVVCWGMYGAEDDVVVAAPQTGRFGK